MGMRFVTWESARPARYNVTHRLLNERAIEFVRGDGFWELAPIAFSKCGSRGRRVCLETGVGGVKGRFLKHELSCVALDLFL